VTKDTNDYEFITVMENTYTQLNSNNNLNINSAQSFRRPKKM